MKIELIASAYMRDDEEPKMVVSMKMYNQLMKSREKIEMKFCGLTSTAEGNHRLIFEAYGLEYPEGQTYPLPDLMKISFKKSEDER